jgi:nitrate reductase gamma subunit
MEIAILKLLTYVSGLVFVVAFGAKVLKYFTMPMHVRWELYPIPHEGKPYGGSFFEEVDHWKKTRHKDHLAQYAFMVPEILFIRALYEDNRPLWYWTFPFHIGLYFCLGGLVFLFLGAILESIGLSSSTSALASLVQALTLIFGVIGYVAGTIGVVGLIIRRASDPMLKDFTVPIDYLNLVWLGGIFITGFLVWLVDPRFDAARQFLVSTITFSPMADPGKLTWLHVVNLLLFLGFWAYFPFTHMSHMMSKYFLWDKVKWDDDPNVGDAGMSSRIKKYLAYPVTWAGPHIGAEGGRKTWADVATANPWAAQEEKK